MQQDIGIATIQYNENGNATTGSFEPMINCGATDKLIKGLLQVRGSSEEQEMVRNAESLMAAWFLKVDEIELADRQKSTIVSKIVSCSKYPNGKPQEVRIKFTMQPLN